MVCNFREPDTTEQTIQDVALHTGDLGRIDDDGNVFIVGRKKEMILGPSGENVYPDELEEVYRDSKYIKEMSVVGLPSIDAGAHSRTGGVGHETVAALIVPDYDQGEGADRRVREAVREHVKQISKTLPLYKRLKVVHLWDHDLPKTASRKVRRRDVIKELQRLERAARGGAEARQLGEAAQRSGTAWIHDVLADVSQRKRGTITSETTLADLGFDSLMFTELAVALEAAGVELPDPAELQGVETVADVEKLVARLGAKARSEKPKRDRIKREKDAEDKLPDEDIDVPG